MFWLSFSTENAVPSAHRKLKKKSTKLEKFSKFQNPEKPFQKCPNLLEVIFSELFLPSATWRSNFVKIRRKNEKKIDFSKVSKTFLEVSKQVSNLFWGNFLKKNCPVHPGKSKLGKTSKNWKTFYFFKMPKYVPKSVQTCFQHASRFFSGEKFRPVHPGGSRSQKNSKKPKKSHIFKIPKNISKSVQICFELIFFEIFLTSAPWRSKLAENRKKNRKRLSS